MHDYFKLQFKMMNRRFRDAGIIPCVAYLLLLIAFIFISNYLFLKVDFADYLYLLIAILVVGKLSDSLRNEFLRLSFKEAIFKKIRIIENLIVVIPFIGFLCYKQFFFLSLFLLSISLMMSLMVFKTIFNFTLWTPFSKQPFEFTIGFRNSYYLFLIAYALSVIAIIIDNFNLGVFALLLIFITTLSYYTKPEHQYYVWNYKKNARAFLFYKLKTAYTLSSVLALPVLVSLSVFYFDKIDFLFMSFAIGWLLLTFMILSKYSAYPDEINVIQWTVFIVSIWFPPLFVACIPYLFIKSEKQLNNFLK